MTAKEKLHGAKSRLAPDATIDEALEWLQSTAQSSETPEEGGGSKSASRFDVIAENHAVMKIHLLQMDAFLTDPRTRLVVVVLCLAFALAGAVAWAPAQEVLFPVFLGACPVAMAVILAFANSMIRRPKRPLSQLFQVVLLGATDSSLLAMSFNFLGLAIGITGGEYLAWWNILTIVPTFSVLWLLIFNTRADPRVNAQAEETAGGPRGL